MQLITNRTEADINVGSNNGYYNYTDLNRVNSACIELKELMLSIGYGVDSSHKTDWTMMDYPTESSIAEYLSNIYKVIDGFFQVNSYDLPSDLQNFTYTSANNIEKALADILTLVSSIKDIYQYSGQCMAGYEGLRGYAL